MTRLASRLLLLSAVLFSAACDEEMIGLDEGQASSLTVHVFVDADGDGAFDPSVDQGLDGATVTASGPMSLTETTSAGVAEFATLPPGSYRLGLDAAAPAGATLVTASQPVVVAPFQGEELVSEFRFSNFPGEISGRLWREENDNGAYDEGVDLAAPGIQVTLHSGQGAEGEPLTSVATDSEGAFSFETLRPGEYTVEVLGPETIEVVGGAVRTVTVEPDGVADLALVFEGTLLVDMATAREAPEGQTVTVQGTLTWVPGFDDRVLFLQDETGALSVFDFDLPEGLAVGDRVQLTGTRGSFRGEVQISDVVSFEVLGNVGAPAPLPVTAAEINEGLHQGRLVSADGVVQSVEVLSFDNQLVTLEDETGTPFAVYVDSRTGVGPDAWVEGETFGVVGVLGTDDRDDLPHRIEVRMPEDVQRGGATVDIATARNSVGSPVVIEGIVTYGPEADDRVIFVQDETGGLSLFTFDLPEGIQRGDLVRIRGTVGSFRGEVQISPVEAVEILGNVPVPAPRGVTAAQLGAGEAQGELVVVTGTVTEVEALSFGNQRVLLEDPAGDTFAVFADSRIGVTEEAWTTGETYRVTGVVGNDERNDPAAQVEVRGPDDVETASAGVLSVAEARGMPGETVTVEAVVTRQTPWDERVYFLQDATAGISTFHNGAPELSPGDRIRLSGEVGAFRGETQFGSVSELTVLEQVEVPAPLEVTGDQINSGLFQGQLATLAGEVASVEQVNDFGTHVVTLTDGSGTAVRVYVDNRSGVSLDDWTVGEAVVVVGVLGTDDRDTPASRLEVLQAADVDFGT